MSETGRNQATKKCPFCGETIQAVAQKCRHCGEWLSGRGDEALPPANVPHQPPGPVVEQEKEGQRATPVVPGAGSEPRPGDDPGPGGGLDKPQAQTPHAAQQVNIEQAPQQGGQPVQNVHVNVTSPQAPQAPPPHVNVHPAQAYRPRPPESPAFAIITLILMILMWPIGVIMCFVGMITGPKRGCFVTMFIVLGIVWPIVVIVGFVIFGLIMEAQQQGAFNP